jgi:hypothetical protein
MNIAILFEYNWLTYIEFKLTSFNEFFFYQTLIIFFLNLFYQWNKCRSSEYSRFIQSLLKKILLKEKNIEKNWSTLIFNIRYCLSNNQWYSFTRFISKNTKNNSIIERIIPIKSIYYCNETWNLVVGRIWVAAFSNRMTGSKLNFIINSNFYEILFFSYFFTSTGIWILSRWTYSSSWLRRLIYVTLRENFALKDKGYKSKDKRIFYLIIERRNGQRNLIHFVGWTI